MNNHFEPLDNGEVLSISESALIYIGHTTFRVGEFSEAVRSQLEHNTEGWNEGKNSWFTDMGVDCEVLRFTSGGWQKGKVRLRLEFAPEDGDGGSDRHQDSVQPSVSGIKTTPEAASTLSEHPIAPTGFVDATSPIAAAVVGAAVVGGVALGLGNDDLSPEATSVDENFDEDFNLAPAVAESELVGLDEGDFDLVPPSNNFNNPEESGLEDIDFAGDNLSFQPEVNNLENDDFDLESASTDLLGLESEDFSLETSDADLSDLSDVDFALEEDPLGDGIENQGATSLEEAEFDLGTTDADLSDLAEDDFNLGGMGEESNLETPDFSLETSLVEEDLTSLGDTDFGLESNAELELTSSENADLSSLGAEDFDADFNTELSGFGDSEFASETPNSEQEMGGLGDNDFGFADSPSDEFTSLGSDDFGLDSLDTDFSGLEDADFGADSPESMSFLESTETGGLEDEFGLETPELSSAVPQEAGEPDFGLDELLGNDSAGEDLEFLSISDQDKQEIEQAAAAVSQAFDDDFGLELESRNGADVDGLDFDFAGDDEVDAIDKQLADAMGNDLDLLGTSEGLTENLFADQDDALFKDVWEDINKSQVR